MKALFVIGPSGAGKTTLIRRLMPDAVHIRIDWTNDRAELGGRIAESWHEFREAIANHQDLAVESTTMQTLWQRISEAHDAGYATEIITLDGYGKL